MQEKHKSAYICMFDDILLWDDGWALCNNQQACSMDCISTQFERFAFMLFNGLDFEGAMAQYLSCMMA